MMVSDLYNSCVPDEKVAMGIFRNIRWAKGVHCPKCKSFKVKKKGKEGCVNRYACNSCENNSVIFQTQFSIKSEYRGVQCCIYYLI